MRLTLVYQRIAGAAIVTASITAAAIAVSEREPAGASNFASPTSNAPPTTTVDATSSGIVVNISTENGLGGEGPGAVEVSSAVAVRLECAVFEAPDPGVDGIPGHEVVDTSSIAVGTQVWVRCRANGGPGGDFVLTTWNPAVPMITADQLAQVAVAQLVVPLPDPEMWPAPDNQLTGLATWLHLPDWSELTSTAALGGLSVTVRARPLQSRWIFPDGSVTCHDAGTPWTTGADDDSTCSIVPTTASFTRPDVVDHATVTTTWERSWTASTGESRTLAPLDRTTTIPLTIREYQVTTR